jgi:hypothetical protein
MKRQNKQRLEQLVRQGIVPSNKLPMLMQAMSSLQMGKQLQPVERDVLAKYMLNMTDIMLKDDTVFNRARLHTQKTKYQTEETTVDLEEKMVDGVEIVDGPEEQSDKMKEKKLAAKKLDKEVEAVKEDMDPDQEERERKKAENKARKLSIKSRDKFRLLPKEIRKEKEKAGLDEDIAKMNEAYKAKFQAALKKFGVSNIRDLPAEKKKAFFNHVDDTHTSKDEMGEEVEKLDEYGSPSQPKNPAATPDRLKMIAKAAQKVQSGQSDAAKRAEKAAKRDMSEQIRSLRNVIKEGTTKQKLEAYAELNELLREKLTGEQ